MKIILLLVILIQSQTLEELQLKYDSLKTELSILKIKIDNFDKDSLNTNCNISKKVDDFDGSITYETEITDRVSILKIKSGKSITYYLSIYIKENNIYNGKGVCIILENNKRINKPNEEVKSSYLGSSFYVHSFITLTKNDINLLKTNAIEKYKLYISEDEILDVNSTILFNCLLKE